MRILAALFGVILLLPGLCSLGFMALSFPGIFTSGRGEDAQLILLWIVCFGISFCGILLIRYAVSGGRSGAPPGGAGAGGGTTAP